MKRLPMARAREVAKAIDADYVIILAASRPDDAGVRTGEFVWWGRNRQSCRDADAVGQMVKAISDTENPDG